MSVMSHKVFNLIPERVVEAQVPVAYILSITRVGGERWISGETDNTPAFNSRAVSAKHSNREVIRYSN